VSAPGFFFQSLQKGKEQEGGEKNSRHRQVKDWKKGGVKRGNKVKQDGVGGGGACICLIMKWQVGSKGGKKREKKRRGSSNSKGD